MTNIAEIARLAGVSKTTVSRVLNNKPDVKPETKGRIAELIRQYDFHPNASAKAISSRKGINTIGLIIPYDSNYIFGNPFNTEIMRGVTLETNAAGYHLMLCHYRKEEYVAVYKQNRVSGFILVSPGQDNLNMLDRIQEMGAPLVSTSRVPGMRGVPSIEVDNVYGGSLAIEHLINLGHRRIGVIKGPSQLASSSDRFAGYCQTLARHGIPVDEALVAHGYTSIESGYQATETLLRNNTDMTAVFAASDLMAIGVISAINQAGLSVPDDISVVGYDNIPLAGSLNPPLTTVDQHADEKGACAARILIDIIEGKEDKAGRVIDVDLKVRGSTGPRKC